VRGGALLVSASVSIVPHLRHETIKTPPVLPADSEQAA
jgi:hypothetical protein